MRRCDLQPPQPPAELAPLVLRHTYGSLDLQGSSIAEPATLHMYLCMWVESNKDEEGKTGTSRDQQKQQIVPPLPASHLLRRRITSHGLVSQAIKTDRRSRFSGQASCCGVGRSGMAASARFCRCDCLSPRIKKIGATQMAR